MKTIKISNLQEGDLFIYKDVMYEIVHKDKDEFERKYKIHLCNIMKCFRFANRGKVTDIKIDKEE